LKAAKHSKGAKPVAAPSLVLSLQQPEACHRQLLTRPRVLRWVRAALQGTPAQITIRVVGLSEALSLNRDFRGGDHATNVLTFDYERVPRVEADIVLCAAVVEREALEQGKPLANHYTHLVVHGVLHAMGMDHQQAREAKKMEAMEVVVLAGLGVPSPYET
jgi:probable rRNA maturation factor